LTAEEAEMRETARRLAELAGLSDPAAAAENVAGTQRFLAQTVGLLRTLDLQEHEPATVFRPAPAEAGS
jgi:hypothetical protein